MNAELRAEYLGRLCEAQAPEPEAHLAELMEIVEQAYDDGDHDGIKRSALLTESFGRGIASELRERLEKGRAQGVLDVREADVDEGLDPGEEMGEEPQ